MAIGVLSWTGLRVFGVAVFVLERAGGARHSHGMARQIRL
jgi:hypothetical protein